MLVPFALLAAAMMQGDAAPRGDVPRAPFRTPAIRADVAPVIDGRIGDRVWSVAEPITEFLEFDPNEGKAPRFATEVRVAYDHGSFYVFVRAFDDEPEKIRMELARRDVRPPTDQIKLIIDSYFDRRSGYQFAVSPSGVKRDYVIYNDGVEDGSWDGVWDVATTVDSLGWTAEFRIPLSQLRYETKAEHTFGFAVWRDIDRYKERVSWPLYRRNQPGLASQLGELTGIHDLPSPRRLEMAPYAVTRNLTIPEGSGFVHEQQLTAGADFKYGVTSNITLDGTINPDFGQVEADPSVLNLTAFETFYRERRPFFLEGVGLFQFSINCSVVNDCGQENLFYSRRIGRAPQLSGLYGDERSASATTIIGAAKMTGRLPGGWSVGVLDAVTQREAGVDDQTIEPATNYAVARATRDYRNGETGIGVIGTYVARAMDQWSRDVLRSDAMTAGIDVRHRFLDRRYQITGKIVGSRVSGTAEAIAATQRNNVHLYQRPDGDLNYDPTRTDLSGDFEQVTFGKVGGGNFRFETSYQRTSPGFEINDLGFLNRADQQSQTTWGQFAFQKPTSTYRRLFWNLNQANTWTAAGLPTDRMVNTNTHMELPFSWWLHAGGTLYGLGEVYCDRCARGGPALRTDGGVSLWGGFEGDERRTLSPGLWVNYNRRDRGRTRSFSLSPEVAARVSSGLNVSLGASVGENRDDRQWYANLTDDVGATHYTFAHLEQKTLALTGRVDFTATPNLTLQVYAQPYLTKGTYSNLRELAQPRATSYDDRFKPYAAVTPAGFSFQDFNSNVVLRWEYRPGSALFVVWQQGRQDTANTEGTGNAGDDFRNLFDVHPNNTFLVKLSYWFDR